MLSKLGPISIQSPAINGVALRNVDFTKPLNRKMGRTDSKIMKLPIIKSIIARLQMKEMEEKFPELDKSTLLSILM